MTSLASAVKISVEVSTEVEVSDQKRLIPTWDFISSNYQPLFYKLASSVYADVGDVRSMAYLTYIDSQVDFDSSRGSFLSRFIFLLSRRVYDDYSSISCELSENYEEVIAAEETVEIENWRTDESLKSKNLGGDLNTIIQHILNGFTFPEIANKMGITLRRVEQIAQKAMSVNEEQADLFR